MKHYDKMDDLIERALHEDVNGYDCTTEAIFTPDQRSEAILIAKSDGIIAGLEVFQRVFKCLDKDSTIEFFFNDGDRVQGGDRILRIKGRTHALLVGERTALNLIQRMSGIATQTQACVRCVEGTKAKIVDTRKTAPGLRFLDKMAIRMGGGYNHRMGLYDAAMIKDNHITAAGGIKNAVERVRANVSHMTKIEVEVQTLEDLETAIESGADVVMLDNMSLAEVKKAVDHAAGRVLLEASGNITLDCVKEVAQTGVDIISIGALTHSVLALDLSFKIISLNL